MQPPFWKKWLSYLSEITVEETSSSYNPYLKVSLHKGRYMLSTPGAIYSFGDLYTNFYYAFRALDFSKMAGRDVLLLGLGLGSIPEMLEQKFNRHFRYTAVEIDDTVSWLAHHYVLQFLDSPIQYVSADAIPYLAQGEERFDMICMDVFQDDKVPELMETVSFLLQLKKRLKPEGVLIFNRLAMNPKDRKESNAYYREVFLEVFPRGGYFNTRTNWMLTNRPDWFSRKPGLVI